MKSSPKHGQYLVARAGDGKTYILGAVIRRLIDQGWHKENCISPWPIIYVTKASVVLQTEEVLRKDFGIDTVRECIVIGIDQLRCRFGQMFLTEKTEVECGEEKIIWQWKPVIRPKLIIVDEGHIAKNEGSTQHKILTSYSALPDVYMIWSSATPYTRVCEAKAFCLSTKINIPFGALSGRPLTALNWEQFANDCCQTCKPDEYNKAAVNRLTNVVDDYIVRVKGVHWQFNPINNYELIDFETNEGREFYRSAEERFFRRKAKLEAGGVPAGMLKGYMLAIMTQYNIAAESNPDRAHIIARAMYHDAQEGFAPVCAMKYKISISRIIKILMEEYGVKRSQFSVIWGGSKVILSKKAQNKQALTANQDLLDAMTEAGIDLDSIGLSDDDVVIQENIQFADDLKLATQNAKQRELEKNNFLSGKTIYCFFSTKAGGVGLSLHHTDALVTPKCRRKDSGYAIEEDIPLVPTRPRRLYGPPIYSAIDVIQFLGRCARITSLSDTIQTLLFFRGTIEERVHAICSVKLKCLSAVIRNNESWESVIAGGSTRDREAETIKYLADTGEVISGDDEDNHIGESDED